MEFLYNLNFNDSSELEVKEFFKKFLVICNNDCRELHAGFSHRLIGFFGDRDTTVTEVYMYGYKEHEENAIYSIHLASHLDTDIDRTKFYFELLKEECPNDFPILEKELSFDLGLNEPITDSILDEISKKYFEFKDELIELSQEYINTHMS